MCFTLIVCTDVLGDQRETNEIIRRIKLMAKRSLRFVYNRVPKCGSRTVYSVFKELEENDKLTCSHQAIFHHQYLNSSAEVCFTLFIIIT